MRRSGVAVMAPGWPLLDLAGCGLAAGCLLGTDAAAEVMLSEIVFADKFRSLCCGPISGRQAP